MGKGSGDYRIQIDGRWHLEDLRTFTGEYQKLYAFFFHLQSKRQSDRARLSAALPWQGGFSTVNFFEGLIREVPNTAQPRIVRMQYASPGWLEFDLLANVATQIAVAVTVVCTSFNSAAETYGYIQRGLARLKLTKTPAKSRELQLERERREFVRLALRDLRALLGSDLVDQVLAISPNELAGLKTLLTVMRRIEPLADLRNRGMITSFDGEESNAVPKGKRKISKPRQRAKAARKPRRSGS